MLPQFAANLGLDSLRGLAIVAPLQITAWGKARGKSMNKARRCAVVIGWAALMLILSGCNPLMFAYFPAYMMGLDKDQNVKVKFPTTSARIAVVTYAPNAMRIEWGRVDKEVNERLQRRIAAHFKDINRKNKAGVIPAAKVSKWLDEHPDWHQLPPDELAKALDADFVILVEIQSLDFYAPRSRFFYQGHAEVKMRVVHADPEYDGLGLMPEEYVILDYPTEAHPIPADSKPYPHFRREFLEKVAERLSWYFVPHETSDEFRNNF
jgi:hypothetical protein